MRLQSGLQTSPKPIGGNWTRQNDALRTATGCTRMTAIDHLTQDTLCLSVKNHNEILASQFAADMKNPDHPCHELQANNEERIAIRKSMSNHLKTTQTTLDITDEEATRENLHKAYVIDTIANRTL